MAAVFACATDVGAEFGPLAVIAVGLVLRRWNLIRRVSLALGAGFPCAAPARKRTSLSRG